MGTELVNLSVVTNASTPRRDVRDGKTYWVTSATILVPGVLNGSRGPLFYPDDEVAAKPGQWNGVKAVVYHPTDASGKSVSADSPAADRTAHVGVLYADRVENGSRRVDVWFDEAATENYDATRLSHLPVENRILPRVKAGRPVELSTGLYTDNEPVANDGTNKCPRTGKTYLEVARNYRPDHLAVLPDQTGACSVRDGCGVNNSDATPTDTGVPTTNCDADSGKPCTRCSDKAKVKRRAKVAALVGNFMTTPGKKGCNQFTRGRCGKTVNDPSHQPSLLDRLKTMLGGGPATRKPRRNKFRDVAGRHVERIGRTETRGKSGFGKRKAGINL